MIQLNRISRGRFRIDGRGLLPERLASLSAARILAEMLPTDIGPVALGELFSVEHSQDEEEVLCIRGDCGDIDGLGSGMRKGVLLVDGPVGDALGEFLVGGMIYASGNAGRYACRGMKDGLVAIGGDCGDRLAAPLPGERSGLRGGEILIAGNLGERACERMRRGTVLVGGDVSEYLAPQMIAGTILVLGHVGAHWGMGMRRGSLIFRQEAQGEPAAMLSPGRDYELSFLPLVWKRLGAVQLAMNARCNPVLGRPIGTISLPSTRWVKRQLGDLSVNGRGEVLILNRLTSQSH